MAEVPVPDGEVGRVPDDNVIARPVGLLGLACPRVLRSE